MVRFFKMKGVAAGLAKEWLISVISSLCALLLVRWLTEPIPNFTTVVFKWMGSSFIASTLGYIFIRSHMRVRDIITPKSFFYLVAAISIKESLLLTCLLLGFFHLTTPMEAALLVALDFFITIVLLVYVRIRDEKLRINIRQLAASKTALVVGTDSAALSMAHMLKKEDGIHIVGLITFDKLMDGVMVADFPAYYCENIREIEQLKWKLGGIDCLFFPRSDAEETCNKQSGETKKNQMTDGLSPLGRHVKRSFDFTLSFILLIIFSPLIAICAWFVKHEDGGPVFYRQERIGKFGKPFRLLKFRSMRTDAESMGVPALCSGEEDPRLTRVGRFLRMHHLDELPQLWNVLCGDMSFVGWRPERQFFIDQIMQQDNRFQYLYQIRPGVTSFATLYNGYTDTLDKMLTRLDLDIYYLKGRSIWFDMKVLGLTFLSIVTGKKF